MENNFVLKISNPNGTSEIVTIDLNGSISEQMRPVAEKRAQVRHAYLGIVTPAQELYPLFDKSLDDPKMWNNIVPFDLDMVYESVQRKCR